MELFKIVNDVLPKSPQQILSVVYDNRSVDPNVEVTPKQVQIPPKLNWTSNKDAYYTLIFTDPDVPASFNFRQFTHWLVVNIPGVDINAGSCVFQYLGSGPPQGSGFHRYVFMVYKQPGKLSPSATSNITDVKITDRGEFSISKFIEDNKLEGPVAANFFRAQYDDSVPYLHEKLKEKYGDFGK